MPNCFISGRSLKSVNDEIHKLHDSINREKNMLNDILKDKTVVVIGRARYLLKNPYLEEQGKFIDDHDVVVRINHPCAKRCLSFRCSNEDGCFIDPEWHDVFGTRTDIYYVNKGRFVSSPDILDVFVKEGGKVICNRKFRHDNYTAISNAISEVCYHHEISGRVDYELSDLTYMVGGVKTTIDTKGNEVTRHVGPDTGHLAVWEILTHGVKHVSLIGFTQHQTNHPQEKEQYEKRKAHPFQSLDHGLLLFKMKSAQDPRLKLDDMLLTLFERKKDLLEELECQINERKKQWYE